MPSEPPVSPAPDPLTPKSSDDQREFDDPAARTKPPLPKPPPTKPPLTKPHVSDPKMPPEDPDGSWDGYRRV